MFFSNFAGANQLRENDGTEEREASDDECFSYFTKLLPYMYESCVSNESVKENCTGKE